MPDINPSQDPYDPRFRSSEIEVAGAAVRRIWASAAPRELTGDCDLRDGNLMLYLVHRGRCTLARSDGRGAPSSAPAGRFTAHFNDRTPMTFVIRPRTRMTLLCVPDDDLRRLAGDGSIDGSAHSAPLRVLAAHVDAVTATAGLLPPASARGARNAMAELVRGALLDAVDTQEPLLAPAIAEAARRIAEEMLDRRDLSPHLVAQQLHMSARSLHRAFGDQDETLMAWVRRRRLEHAIEDLTGPQPRPSVAEAAARWCFSDTSHLSRACRDRYGMSPKDLIASRKTQPER